MEEFEDSWPEGFHETINEEVHIMAMMQRHIKASGKEIYDTGVIYLQ